MAPWFELSQTSALLGGAFGLGLFLIAPFVAKRIKDRTHPPPPWRKPSSPLATKQPPSVMKKIMSKVAMLGFPFASAAASLFLLTHSDSVMAKVPAIFASYAEASIRAVLPIHPKNLLDAFEFGRLVEQIKANSSPVVEILANATRLAGRTVSSVAEVLAVESTITEMTNGKSIITRVLGAFSLVNIVWFASICGILMFASPFLYLIAKPVVEAVSKAVTWLFINVLLPLGKALMPVYEPLIYLIGLLIQIEALRYPRDEYTMAGPMIALTGVGVQLLGWFYSVYYHSTGGGDVDQFICITSLLFSVMAGPAAILHQSSMLGYVSVSAFCSFLGFMGAADMFGFVIGFDNYRRTLQTLYGTGLLNFVHVMFRWSGSDGVAMIGPYNVLQPFQSAINVYSVAVYLLALMVMAGRHKGWLIGFGANVIGLIVTGTVLDLPAMRNTALTYAGLCGWMLACVNWPRDGGAKIAYAMGLSVAGYAFSLWLSRNPIYVATLMNPSLV